MGVAGEGGALNIEVPKTTGIPATKTGGFVSIEIAVALWDGGGLRFVTDVVEAARLWEGGGLSWAIAAATVV